MPFVPSLGFFHPFKSKNYAHHSRRLQSELSSFFDPPIPPPHTADFRFSSLVARSQTRQNLCFAAILAARHSKGHPAIPKTYYSIRLETIRIPPVQSI
ncbi:hypothetical protein AVEN_126047-1 [Araneus ventricosus]|uniref:Uncharacterized protein n=1 Tax=Araneus ventricosus TaxID=182803 RepID=A0A4Y2EUV7_ARAVE|nr:hypothetical protein AVEN_126047-1 [Araneus ventricosus]